MNIDANGIQIHYTLEGPAGAPVVMMSHSLAANLSMWDPQLGVLTARYRVLRYDTRGHGGTDAPEGPYSLGQLAEDARALVQTLGIQRTSFIGLSMGSMIGQVLALTYPEMIQCLILCEASSRTSPELKLIWDERIRVAQTQGMGAHVESTIDRWFTAPFQERRADVVDPVRAMIRATKPAGYIGCIHAIKGLDLVGRQNAIQVPTLIIVGEQDPASPVANSQAIHERIQGSELVILKSAAHLSNMEQPEAFNRVVLAFLEKFGTGGGPFKDRASSRGRAS
jgi:3-oxoadipate enol-lactonase